MVDVVTFCGNCGNPSGDAADRFCRKCGGPLDHATAAGVGPSIDAPPPPYPSSTPPPPPYPAGAPPTFRQQSMNGLAIASLVLGILWLYWLGSILALVFGYIARKQIDRSNGNEKCRGLATAGIVLGWVGIGLAVVGIVVGIFVFAAGNTHSSGNVPSVNSTSQSQDCSAEKDTLSTALEAYKAETGAYPTSMSQLTTGQYALLRTAPADYAFDSLGNVRAIPDNPGGCT